MQRDSSEVQEKGWHSPKQTWTNTHAPPPPHGVFLNAMFFLQGVIMTSETVMPHKQSNSLHTFLSICSPSVTHTHTHTVWPHSYNLSPGRKGRFWQEGHKWVWNEQTQHLARFCWGSGSVSEDNLIKTRVAKGGRHFRLLVRQISTDR